jgi:hypothetical protein
MVGIFHLILSLTQPSAQTCHSDRSGPTHFLQLHSVKLSGREVEESLFDLIAPATPNFYCDHEVGVRSHRCFRRSVCNSAGSGP